MRLSSLVVKEIVWTDVKKKICSVKPPSVQALSNAELQVLIRNVPTLRKSRDENTVDEVVAVFEERRELDGQDFQEFEEDGFSAFADEDTALQKQIKHVYRCVREYLRKL